MRRLLKRRRRRRVSPGELERRYLRWLGYGALVALVSVWLFARPNSMTVETLYARGIYPGIARVLVPITNALPFSLAAVLLLGLPLLFIFVLVRSYKRYSFKNWLVLSLGRGFTAALILYALFILNWGANYERASVETQFALQTRSVTQADVVSLTQDLQGVLERTHRATPDVEAAISAIQRELISLNFRTTGVRATLPKTVKRLPAGSLIISGGASGVVSPWTLEPHIDGALSATDQVAVGAHELAHIAGYAGEADADLLGALAGLGANNDFANYATALRLWASANWQLPPELAQANYERLPERVKQDYEAVLAPYRLYRIPDVLRNVQRRTYDSYLKSQGVTSGVKDYSRTVDLLVLAKGEGLVFGN